MWHFSPSKRDLMVSLYKQVLGCTRRSSEVSRGSSGLSRWVPAQPPPKTPWHSAVLYAVQSRTYCFGAIFTYILSLLLGSLKEGGDCSNLCASCCGRSLALIMEGAGYKQFLNERIGLARPLRPQQAKRPLEEALRFYFIHLNEIMYYYLFILKEVHIYK